MAFAQLTHRESLRDIEACLRVQKNKLYHMGIRAMVSRSTLADAGEQRDWRIYANFAQSLIKIARSLYAEEDLGLGLESTVYALDASTIDLCLSVFPWAVSFNKISGKTSSLRRVKYHDSKSGKIFNFLTNNFIIPAQTVANLYRYRWQVELFFKWIKQHYLRKYD